MFLEEIANLQVHIFGFVPDADFMHCIEKPSVLSLLMVFANFFGPDNIPPLEAFAIGCSVIAARVPGSEDQLENATLLFDPADPADIAWQF